MKDAQGRRASISECLSLRSDLDWCFFDAFRSDGPVHLESNPDVQTSRYGRPLTPAETGCFKSHYKVILDHSQQDDTKWLLVLEDDVWLDPNFSISEVIDFCDDRQIDYCRLFAKSYKPAKVIGQITGFRQILRFNSDPYGTQAYLISAAGAKKFINSLPDISLPVDDELGRFWRHGLDAVSVFPFPVVERSAPSHIDQGRVEGNKNRVSRRIDLILFRVLEKIRKIVYNFAYSIESRFS